MPVRRHRAQADSPRLTSHRILCRLHSAPVDYAVSQREIGPMADWTLTGTDSGATLPAIPEGRSRSSGFVARSDWGGLGLRHRQTASDGTGSECRFAWSGAE